MMNNTLYGQMAMDVMNTANNMVIQQVCAEKGINFNQLMAQAQQQHINNIMVSAQQRMIAKEVKRHYQGDSFMGKVRDLFSGDNSSDMMFPGFMPQQQPVMPMYPMQPQMVQQPMVPPTAPMPVAEVPLSVPNDTDARMTALEEDVKKINGFLEQLAQRLQEGAGN